MIVNVRLWILEWDKQTQSNNVSFSFSFRSLNEKESVQVTKGCVALDIFGMFFTALPTGLRLSGSGIV